MRSKTSNYLAAFLILLAGCSVAAWLASGGNDDAESEPQPQALVVETFCVRNTNHRLRIPAWGIVEAKETIDIRPEVGGKVGKVSPDLFIGGTVKRGESLFSIDARPYENALAEAKAAHDQEAQSLTIEQGRQTIAQSEWKLLDGMDWKGARNKPLALRHPQLKIRQAALQMALAKQDQAALDLERTRITAPCEGVILEKKVARGQVLDSGDVALQLACTTCYHVLAYFPTAYELDSDVSDVTIEIGTDRYEGTIKSVLPRIDPKTRQKQVLVAFDGDGIVLGSYAALTLPGPIFSGCAVLPDAALRSGDTVWVLGEKNTLDIRKVEVLGRDPDHVIVGSGLAEGERVILSHIASPLKGMPLRDYLKEQK